MVGKRIDAIRLVYLPVNCAWMVMWHDQRLAGPMPKAAAEAYIRAVELCNATCPEDLPCPCIDPTQERK